MKREGRQHGMVRTFRILPNPLNPRPETRFVTRFDTPPTAGSFTRVSTKPTNHSKFTGKSDTMAVKDKIKGNQKSKSNDVVSNPRLLTWRVAGTRPGSNRSGYCATGILDQLMTDDHEYDDNDDDESYDEDYDQTRIDEDIKEDESWYLV